MARIDSADDTPAAVLLLVDRLRVVQIIPALAFGGLERVATTLTVGLEQRVGRIVVCSSGAAGYVGGAPLDAELRGAGVDVVLVPRPTPGNPARYARSIAALARVIKRERPDLVHAHNPGAAAAAAAARAVAGARDTAIVTTHHGVKGHRLRQAVRVLNASSDLVVGIGPTVTRELRAAGLPDSRSATVFNAIDVHAARPRDEVRREFDAEDAELVVTVGRYVEEKNQGLLLDATALLRESRPRLRVFVIGYGRLEGKLRRRVRQLGLGDSALITGPREDAVSIMAAADVFALPSAQEGLGLVALEAMAVGCPVVATAVGGIVDTVRDGRTGLLVRDQGAEAFAAALVRLLDDENLRQQVAAGGEDLVRREFSVERMVEGYAEVYERAVRQRRSN